MAQTTLSIRMDEGLKQEFDSTCEDLGLTMSTAVTILAKKMTREKRLPFEVSIDPFYSESNLKHLNKIIEGIENGTRPLTEHELMEVDSV